MNKFMGRSNLANISNGTSCNVPNMLDYKKQMLQKNSLTQGNHQIDTDNVHQAPSMVQEPSASDSYSPGNLQNRGNSNSTEEKLKLLERGAQPQLPDPPTQNLKDNHLF